MKHFEEEKSKTQQHSKKDKTSTSKQRTSDGTSSRYNRSRGESSISYGMLSDSNGNACATRETDLQRQPDSRSLSLDSHSTSHVKNTSETADSNRASSRRATRSSKSRCNQDKTRLLLDVDSQEAPQSSRETTELSQNQSIEDDSSTSTTSSQNPKKSRRYIPKNITRKRTVNMSDWIDVKAKEARISGQAGVGRKNELIHPRQMDLQGCLHAACHAKITVQDRQYDFDTYYMLESRLDQWTCLHKWVLLKMIATMGGNSGSPESIPQDTDNSNPSGRYLYRLPLKSGAFVTVCKEMFLKTPDISYQQVKTAKTKMAAAGITGVMSGDQRGLHTENRKNRVSENAKQTAREHIESFPTMESHYCREESNELYLDESVQSIAMMYRLYEKSAQAKKLDDIVTFAMYTHIFNTEFNYGFFRPKKDWCDKCFVYKNSSDAEKEADKEEYEEHLASKNIARRLMYESGEIAAKDSSVVAIHFDLEKVLTTPRSEVGCLYFMSKISVWNFTIYNFGTKKGYCMVWNETIGKRGSNEIASFLYDFFHGVHHPGNKVYILISDNCGGQDRNQNVLSAEKRLSIELKADFIHRFLEVGHTQAPGDSIHANIERRVKDKSIFTQAQWCDEMRKAKIEEPYYEVSEKTQEEIYDFSPLAKLFNWDALRIASVREYEVKHSDPEHVYYKHDLREPQTRLKILKRGRKAGEILSCPITPAYTERFPLSDKKEEDIHKMIKRKIIRPEHRYWYKPMLSRPIDSSSEDDK
ncbi:hypothetical protein QAD02_014090 [Eretmocerus hayati]|uniref:Uncharacterized protein n=1 Tax=Eretmocerus hayati TaxID=131215 RepID=A0ACC2P5B9_9HYME|nr:hypothetical protein QAD02_014090 [Eretmocerus hayati]